MLKCSLWRRANARNVSFSISVRWSIYIINSVDKPNFRVSLPHRCSTTVSLETNPLYSFVIIRVQDSRRWSRTCDSCASLVLSNLPCASIARGTRVNMENHDAYADVDKKLECWNAMFMDVLNKHYWSLDG